MSNPVNPDGLLVHSIAVECKTSTFVIPVEYLSVLRKLQTLVQNGAVITWVITWKAEVVADLHKRFPNIKKIKLIRINLEVSIMRKMLEWTMLILQNNKTGLTKKISSSEYNFIKANKPILHELLKAAKYLDVPNLPWLTLQVKAACQRQARTSFMKGLG